MSRALACVVVLALAACAKPGPPPPAPVREGTFPFSGALTQGGFAIGQAPPGAVAVTLDGTALPLDPGGRFIVGFGRDAAPTARVEVRLGDGTTIGQTLGIAARTYAVESIPELARPTHADPARDAERAAARAAERALIGAARAGRSGLPNWREPIDWPLTGRISGVYGSQRILGGIPANPHGGVDIARPAGTPVLAPAGGRVALAARFSLEGNLVLIDHGHGLVSGLMHLSLIDVAVGQRVARGDPIGAVGATGRATGAHLHWGLTLDDIRLDPALAAGPMPALPTRPSARAAR